MAEAEELFGCGTFARSEIGAELGRQDHRFAETDESVGKPGCASLLAADYCAAMRLVATMVELARSEAPAVDLGPIPKREERAQHPASAVRPQTPSPGWPRQRAETRRRRQEVADQLQHHLAPSQVGGKVAGVTASEGLAVPTWIYHPPACPQLFSERRLSPWAGAEMKGEHATRPP